MRFRPLAVVSAVSILALCTFGCGGSTKPTRELQAITVTPASASSSAQFTATGIFSQPPSPMALTSPDVVWCPSSAVNCSVQQQGDPVLATVDATGNAQCLPGASGTMLIIAVDNRPSPPRGAGTGTAPPPLSGAAHLTCP